MADSHGAEAGYGNTEVDRSGQLAQDFQLIYRLGQTGRGIATLAPQSSRMGQLEIMARKLIQQSEIGSMNTMVEYLNTNLLKLRSNSAHNWVFALSLTMKNSNKVVYTFWHTGCAI